MFKKFLIAVIIVLITQIAFVNKNCYCQWISVGSGIYDDASESLCFSNGKIYSAGYYGVFVSNDNGIKWQRTSLTSQLSSILKKDSCLITGGYGGLYVSTNEGLTWVQTLSSSNGVRTITQFGSYLFTFSDRILRSSNNGFNWEPVTPFSWRYVTSFAINGNSIFAGYASGEYSPGEVMVSTNNGNNWNSTGFDSISITSLNCNNGILFAGTWNNGIFTSTDNGVSWNNIGFIINSITGIFKADSDVYVSCVDLYSNYHLYRSTDNGASWNKINAGGVGNVLAVTKLNNILFVCYEYRGVYLSYDNGINWTHYLPNNVQITCFHKLGSRLFAGVHNNGIYYSDDSGSNWMQTNFNTRLTPYCFTSIGSVLFAGIYDFAYSTDTGGVYVSTDNGINWKRTSIERMTVYSLKYINTSLFAGGAYRGIYKSTNAGVNWTHLSVLPGCSPYCFYQKDSKIFMGIFRDNHYNLTGLYFTTNEGASWDSVQNINSVNEIKENSNYMFASCSGVPGIIRSSNNGMNWNTVPINQGTSTLEVYGNYLFAGTYYDGVYMSSNNGESWRIKNEGFIGHNVRAFMIADGYLFAGEIDYGIQRRLLTDIIPVNTISTKIPSSYSLEQNYPNPFNPMTKIRFDLSQSSPLTPLQRGTVLLKVYDVAGREVQTLVDEVLQPGSYEVTFDGSVLNSGVYFYQLTAGSYRETKKMILIK